MAQDPLADVLHAHVAEQRRGEFGLALHLCPVRGRERPALAQDLGRDLVAADPAHERRKADPRRLLLAQAELASGQHRELHDEPPRVGPVLDPAQPQLLGAAVIAHERQL